MSAGKISHKSPSSGQLFGYIPRMLCLYWFLDREMKQFRLERLPWIVNIRRFFYFCSARTLLSLGIIILLVQVSIRLTHQSSSRKQASGKQSKQVTHQWGQIFILRALDRAIMLSRAQWSALTYQIRVEIPRDNFMVWTTVHDKVIARILPKCDLTDWVFTFNFNLMNWV